MNIRTMLYSRPVSCPALVGALLVASTTLLTGCVTEEDEPGIADSTWDFAYVSLNPPAPGSQRIHVGTLEGEELQVTFDGTQIYDINPLFSPDGAYLAFQRSIDSSAAGGDSDVYVVDMETGEESRLAEIGADEDCRAAPTSWNADSSAVTFRCFGEASFAGVVSLDGVVTLASSTGYDYEQAAFLSGGDVITIAVDEDDVRHLRRYDSALSTGTTVATFDDRLVQDLAPSPDGSLVALTQDVEAGTDAVDRNEAVLLIVDLSSGDVAEHLDGEESGPHGVHSWHPDSQQVLVSTGGWDNPAGRLFLLDVIDGTETLIADTSIIDNGSIDGADISPDGEWIIFGDSNSRALSWNTSSIHLIRTNGEDHRVLTGLSVPDRSSMPTFNPAAF